MFIGFLSLITCKKNIPSPPNICHFDLKWTGHVTPHVVTVDDTFAINIGFNTLKKQQLRYFSFPSCCASRGGMEAQLLSPPAALPACHRSRTCLITQQRTMKLIRFDVAASRAKGLNFTRLLFLMLHPRRPQPLLPPPENCCCLSQVLYGTHKVPVWPFAWCDGTERDGDEMQASSLEGS